jgi:predicted nucleic acid-binding Zn ribbon protein
MRCSKCGAENREGRRFCVQCGQALKLACPSCGAPIEPGEKFCGDCGAALVTAQPRVFQSPTASPNASDIRIAAEEADTSLSTEGERKTVTALFADIQGSTELIRELDPEEARAIVDPVLRLMIEAVHRDGGYVAPHAQRALHAALAMHGELHRYADHMRRRIVQCA